MEVAGEFSNLSDSEDWHAEDYEESADEQEERDYDSEEETAHNPVEHALPTHVKPECDEFHETEYEARLNNDVVIEPFSYETVTMHSEAVTCHDFSRYVIIPPRKSAFGVHVAQNLCFGPMRNELKTIIGNTSSNPMSFKKGEAVAVVKKLSCEKSAPSKYQKHTWIGASRENIVLKARKWTKVICKDAITRHQEYSYIVNQHTDKKYIFLRFRITNGLPTPVVVYLFSIDKVDHIIQKDEQVTKIRRLDERPREVQKKREAQKADPIDTLLIRET